MLKIRFKIIYLVLFKWTGGTGKRNKNISLICESNGKWYSVSISKPLHLDT
jgi:hypothetical protein